MFKLNQPIIKNKVLTWSRDLTVNPHTRLLYEAGAGTNVWSHSYMRCRMKPDEDFTFNRYRVVKQAGKVYYEGGGTLEVFCDGMVYLGVTNYFCDVRNYFLTPTTNIPHGLHLDL